MYAHVCGCGDAASFASLQVCLPFFRLFLFSVCCFRMGPFFFPSLYARANIIMCLSFSSRVLRYKNMLCNTSVIQSITKKFQEIRIIFPSYVCWLSLKGLPLHPQSREITNKRNNGALVQLVRIHACHAWGHGFESRTHRFFMKQNKEKSWSTYFRTFLCLTPHPKAVE